MDLLEEMEKRLSMEMRTGLFCMQKRPWRRDLTADAMAAGVEVFRQYILAKGVEAPIGKTFNECYDMVSVRPTDEYETLFNKKKKQWRELGLDRVQPA